MSKQNRNLIVVIVVLLIANIGLMLGKRKTQSLGYDEATFSIQDTSSVKSIRIGEIELVRQNGWKVGDRPADPAFVDHLLNVLLRVRIKKPAGDALEGIPISVNGDKPFIFSANATKTKTFFSDDDMAYEMEIPGFTDYVGGIFELNVDQWRDRLVYNGSWRTIQKLELDYLDSDDKDFTIQFEKDFFILPGITEIDTAVLINYLNQFQYFMANERLSPGRISAMDSLRETSPMAILTMEDINYPNPQQLKIFPKRKEDSFYLFLDQNDEMIAVDAPRSGQVLREKYDFRFKK